MAFRIKYLLLLTLIAFTTAEKQIDLEDIEHDTLLNEQRNGNPKESLETDQTQHLRPPINAVSSSPYEKTDDTIGNSISDDIAYASSPSSEGVDQYDPQQQIQYVTPSQYDDVKQVHEAHHTYAAPSRQSLITPIVHKQNALPSPYLAQQPRYVYVQAGAQQVSPNGILTYAPHQRPAADHGLPSGSGPQDIAYASVGPVQTNAIQPPLAGPISIGGNRPAANYGPPSPPTHNNNYNLQYVPWLPQTPNPQQQSYYMVLPYRNVPTHTHTQAIFIPQAPFTYTLRQQHPSHPLQLNAIGAAGGSASYPSHSLQVNTIGAAGNLATHPSHSLHLNAIGAAGAYGPHPSHSLQLSAIGAGGVATHPSQSSVTYAHTSAGDASGTGLNTPEANVSPATAAVGPISQSYYQLRPLPYTQAHPSIHYSQQQLHVQQALPYELQQHQQPIVYHQPRPVIQSHYLPPTAPLSGPQHHPLSNLDFLSPYSKQPTSLLDSYVPSSVILGRQRALQARQVLHPVAGTSAIIPGNHQPGYNTIAYSTYQGYTYAKRSPKTVTTTTKLVTAASENVPVTVKINSSSTSSSTAATNKSDVEVKADKSN